MNTAYRDVILARVQAAVGAAKAVTNITHKGLRGQLREIVIRDLFRPLLPADVGVGTGEIISANDCHSRQQDVVIFDRRILPPILFEGATGIFPIESVLYSIEVKSILTSPEIRSSHSNAAELRTFPYLSGQYDEHDKAIHDDTLIPAISAILSFGTDLVPESENEVERYDKIRGPTEDPAIRAICVVGRGYWYWRDDKWQPWPQTYPLQEVVGFVAGVMNTYRKVAASRREPRIGIYLID